MYGTAAYVDVTARHFDEGQMAVMGGGLAVSLTPAFLTEFAVETGNIDHGVSQAFLNRGASDRFRQTLLTVSLLYEGPAGRRFRVLGGGGLGGVFQRWSTVFREIRPRLCCATLPGRYDAGVLHVRLGATMEPRDRLIVRIEGVWWRAVDSTTVGLRGTAGWRF